MATKCTFFMEKKRRTCRFDAKPGYLFCGNHMPEDIGPKRVPCPVNPNHTVLESELAAHVHKCNDAVLKAKQKARISSLGDRSILAAALLSWTLSRLCW